VGDILFSQPSAFALGIRFIGRARHAELRRPRAALCLTDNHRPFELLNLEPLFLTPPRPFSQIEKKILGFPALLSSREIWLQKKSAVN